MHRAFRARHVDGVQLASLPGESFPIEINETGLNVRKDAIAMMHDEHGILVSFDFDFTLIFHFSRRVQHRSHAHDFLGRA